MAWLERAPLWTIWPVLSACFVLAMLAGYGCARLFSLKRGQTQAPDGIGFLLSAALALLGLLVAFTFSMAATRFDARRTAVLNEANAVGTTYLRFQLVDEPVRTKLSGELLAYLAARKYFFAAGSDVRAMDRADAATSRVQNRIWIALTPWIRDQPTNASHVSLLQATNDMFDLAASDRALREARVPLRIIRAITVYSLIAAFLLGQSLAATKINHPVTGAIIFCLVALAITLILDLDRPATGRIAVSTAPFDRAAASIKVMEIARSRN